MNVETNCVYFSAVPAPIVTLRREPDETTQILFLCSVEHIVEIDIPVVVNVQWQGPSSHNNNSRFSISQVNGSFPVYRSFFKINPPIWSDSGRYTCTANMFPEVNSSKIVCGSPWTTEQLTISIRE